MLWGGDLLRAIGCFLLVSTVGLAILAGIAVAQAKSSEAPADEGGKRAPKWLIPVLAALFLLLFAGTAGTGAFSAPPSEPEHSDEILEIAEAASDNPADPPSDELQDAVDEAAPLIVKASTLRKAERVADARVRTSRRTVRTAQRQLKRARRYIRINEKRLYRKQKREAWKQEFLPDPAPPPDTPAPKDQAPPSYDSCATAPPNIPVPPGSHLDADGDGIGCEE